MAGGLLAVRDLTLGEPQEAPQIDDKDDYYPPASSCWSGWRNRISASAVMALQASQPVCLRAEREEQERLTMSGRQHGRPCRLLRIRHPASAIQLDIRLALILDNDGVGVFGHRRALRQVGDILLPVDALR